MHLHDEDATVAAEVVLSWSANGIKIQKSLALVSYASVINLQLTT